MAKSAKYAPEDFCTCVTYAYKSQVYVHVATPRQDYVATPKHNQDTQACRTDNHKKGEPNQRH